jgi:hypothetical protein
MQSDSPRPLASSLAKLCVGSKVQETRFARQQHAHEMRTCQFSPTIRKSGLTEYTKTCDKGGSLIVKIEVVYSGDFKTQFEQKSVLSTDLGLQMDGMSETKRFRFAGKCPKDLQPGETIMKDAQGMTLPKWNRYKEKELTTPRENKE